MDTAGKGMLYVFFSYYHFYVAFSIAFVFSCIQKINFVGLIQRKRRVLTSKAHSWREHLIKAVATLRSY